MNTTTYVGGAAALVLVGRWSQEKPIDVRIAIGAGMAMIFLSMLDDQNKEISRGIGMLMLVSAAFLYVPDIAKKTGITEPRKEKK